MALSSLLFGVLLGCGRHLAAFVQMGSMLHEISSSKTMSAYFSDPKGLILLEIFLTVFW